MKAAKRRGDPPTVAGKVAEARRLLVEATRQDRRERKVADAAHLCRCGHRRDQHTVAVSINYTGGPCMECAGCMGFLYRPDTETGA